MSELMHACAAGNLARVQLRVKEIRMESEERLQDELEVAEGATLDPKQYAVNAKFQGVKVKRGPGAQWTSVTGSGNLRGRLQNMVPPTGFGNPAPR